MEPDADVKYLEELKARVLEKQPNAYRWCKIRNGVVPLAALNMKQCSECEHWVMSEKTNLADPDCDPL